MPPRKIEPEHGIPSISSETSEVLRFPHSGKFHGFRASGLSAYDNVDPNTVIRELVQNSLDASAAAERDIVQLVFEIEDIPMASIPGLTDYREHLKCAVKTQSEKQSLQQAQSIVDGMRASIEQETLPVLWIMDNGTGLDADGMERLLGDGQSAKADESTAGSYGNGHMTSFPASKLRYILYGGINSKNESTVSGHAILASHLFQNQLCGEDGYLSRSVRVNELFNRFDFYNGKDIPLLERKLEFVKQNFGTGSVVGILGFNQFNRYKSDREVLGAIGEVVAAHFVPKILSNSMKAVLRGRDVEEQSVDASSIKEILEARKARRRRERRSIGISGSHVWDVYQTLANEPRHTIETSAGTAGFHFSLLSGDSGYRSHVELFRNGMWISNDLPDNKPSDFAKKLPFCGVISLTHKGAKEACRLLRSFEGPRHIDIDLTRQRQESPDRNKIKQFLGELRDGIRQLIPELEEKEFDPDFFSVQVQGVGNRSDTHKSTSGTGNPERIRRCRPHRIYKQERTKSEKPKRLRRQGSLIQAKITALPDRKGIRVHAKVLEDARNAELRVVLSGGSDDTCDSPDPDQFVEILKGARIGSRKLKRFVRDQHGVRRAALIGPVSANSDELEIWLPCPNLPTGDLRVELVRRAADS